MQFSSVWSEASIIIYKQEVLLEYSFLSVIITHKQEISLLTHIYGLLQLYGNTLVSCFISYQALYGIYLVVGIVLKFYSCKKFSLLGFSTNFSRIKLWSLFLSCNSFKISLCMLIQQSKRKNRLGLAHTSHLQWFAINEAVAEW